jgi:hypothetical protein
MEEGMPVRFGSSGLRLENVLVSSYVYHEIRTYRTGIEHERES